MFTYQEDFIRVASCSPAVSVANPEANAEAILEVLYRAKEQGARLAVVPELAITGYTCGDLFHNSLLLERVEEAMEDVIDNCPSGMTSIVGLPIRIGSALYNCAMVLTRGEVVGISVKTYLPNYNEFYEKRWFTPANPTMPSTLSYGGREAVPFGTDILYNVYGALVGIEICEDAWAPIPPSCRLALSGATVIANLSASDDVIGKYAYLRDLLRQQSARCLCGYVYASAGFGESSTDLVFDGKNIICENGRVVAESDRFCSDSKVAVADIDLLAIERDRRHLMTFTDCAMREVSAPVRIVDADDVVYTHRPCYSHPEDVPMIDRKVNPLPFVPADSDHLAERCEEIIHLQATGLRKRLRATGCRNLVVGISGGLDSTLALLVAVRAFDLEGLDRRGIHGITMPGFGTTDRTYRNAIDLMQALGISIREISIAKAVTQHFADIGHDANVHDVTYENSQARERTQILMDVANAVGGMVLGTGDLSELALGWATYNGDHMSMYAVNAGVPKTLVRHLVRYFVTLLGDEKVAHTLLDIIDTPISPELIPADEQGNITQKTEDLVGPYELHDFFLYYMLRYGFSPRRIFHLAKGAFDQKFDESTIAKWLKIFIKRFFSQQFKRSCLPDGPKIGSVTLSPRGDWRMPSDAQAAEWQKECDKICQSLHNNF
ncbi:MAG: NAD(+) synthase [Muribaculaceae bacterium]